MWRCLVAAAGSAVLWHFKSQLTLTTTMVAAFAILGTSIPPHMLWLVYATFPRDLR